MAEPGVTFRCDHCHQKLHALADLFGKQMHCPRCHGSIDVPVIDPPPPPPVHDKQFFPPTEKQLQFAESLGVQVPEGIGRFELSRLIDEAIDERDDARSPETGEPIVHAVGGI